MIVRRNDKKESDVNATPYKKLIYDYSFSSKGSVLFTSSDDDRTPNKV